MPQPEIINWYNPDYWRHLIYLSVSGRVNTYVIYIFVLFFFVDEIGFDALGDVGLQPSELLF